jgi:predicted adenylyl cyclase CyaB
VRSRLKDAGFVCRGRAHQIDTILDVADASLFRSGCKLRVRVEGDSVDLTYKGRFEGDTSASRRSEIIVPLSQEQVAPITELLQALGYGVCFTISKFRTTYDKHGLKVVVDEWPLLGTLVEIEGPEESTHELAATICPGVRFGNFRLRELFQQLEQETGKPVSQLQAEYERKTGQRIGRLDLAID